MQTHTTNFSKVRRAVLCLVTLAAGANAADYTWGGGSGNWSDGNWTPGPVSGPTAGSDTATINSGTVSLNVGGMNVGALTLGAGGTFNAYNWNGTNTYTGYGNLLLQGGVINGIGNYHNWGAGILVNTTVSGSSASTISASSFFNLNGTGVNSSVFTVADVTGNSNPDLEVSAQLWDVSADTSWSAAALVKEGPGTMRLSNYNGYTGGTTINGGTLEMAGANSGWGLLRGAVTVNSAGTLAITGGDGTGFGWNNPVTSLTINGGTVNASGGTHIGFGSYTTVGLSNGGTIAGSWQWNGDSLLGFTSSGDSTNTINGGLTLRSDAGANHTFNVANGAASVDLQVNANLGDQWPEVWWVSRSVLVKSGAGTMVLAGNNSYDGQTFIQQGTLIAASSTALGPGGHDGNTMSWIYDGATLALQGGISLDEHFHVWGSGVGGLGAVRSLSGDNALTNAPGGGAGYAINSTTTVGVDADTLTVTGFYENGGSYGITKVGNGTLKLTQAATLDLKYTGVTTVNAGTLALGNVGVLTYSTLDTGSSGSQSVTFVVPGANTYRINGLAGSDAVNMGANSLSLGEAGATTSFSGVLDGTGNLIKRGSGTQTLAANNSFSGSVTVMDGGTLSVPTAAASGNQPLGTGTGNISLQGSGSGATLAITGAGEYTLPATRGLSLSGTGGILEVSAGTVNMAGGITSNSNLAHFTKAGAGTLNYSGSAPWSANFTVSDGTFQLTGGGSIAGVGVTTVQGSSTLKISTTGALKAASLDILPGSSVILEAGTLRVGGGDLVGNPSIKNQGSFTWGNGTLSVYTTGSGEAGLTDRTATGGSPSGPAVTEGNYLSVAGDLNASAGSNLDLGSTYLSNGLRYNQLNVSGNLTLNAGSLSFGLNPYFLRPSSANSVATGDWGTMVLVYAEGTLAGTFNQIAGKTLIARIGQDAIGWTQLADIEYTGGGTPFDPASLGLNQWLIEYRDGSGGNGFNFTQSPGGAVLLHYRVAGSVPEPASAGLLMAGALLLRALRRRRG